MDMLQPEAANPKRQAMVIAKMRDGRRSPPDP
jgi:hypothetical protein